MSGDNWQKLDAAFQQALNLEGEARERFVAKFAAEDAELGQQLRNLLRADAADDDSLLSPISAAVESMSRSATDPWIGRTVGSWTITERLAGGGMGAVFLAERADEQFSQTAALKMMATQLVTPEAIARFRAERQILANLNHPYVAKLIDGGSTDDGAPYLVMEYVEGLPVDEHCDKYALTIEARLELFRKICDAVDYAHRNLVVHRDLKPSNILVDADGNPKLLDFGIAKLLEADSYQQTIAVTREGTRAMTPEYASPEQVRGEAVTVTTDVYALGVLLFRLMTGQSPYGTTTTSAGDYARAIVETDPRKPSTVVTAADTAVETGAQRATSSERLRRLLQGDLDNIVLKALQKEPARRYATAAALALDIGRYLAHEPVEARGDDAWYRARKFAVRNARGLAITALVVLSVAALVTYYTLQLADERDRANLAAAESQEVAQFLENLFEQASPHESKGEQVTAIDLLELGRDRIEALEGQPKLQAQLMRIMASSSTALGDLDLSIPMLERALAMMEAEEPQDPVAISEVTHSLSEAHRQRGDLDEAEAYQRRTIELATAAFGANDDRVAYLIARLGVVLFDAGEAEEALALEQQALAIMKANGSGESSNAVDVRGNIGNVLVRLGRYDEAVELFRETIALSKKVDGELAPNTAIRISNYGLVLVRQGKLAEAVAVFEDAIERGRKIWPEDYDEVAFMTGSKAAALKRLGRMDESLAAYQEAAGMTERTRGKESLTYVARMRGLGSVLMDMACYEEAEAVFTDALATAQALAGEDSRLAMQLQIFLGQLAVDRGNFAEAQRYFERVKNSNESQGATVDAIIDKELGIALSEQGLYAEAEPLLLKSFEQQQALQGIDSSSQLPNLAALAGHYRRQGDIESALGYAERIRDLTAEDPKPLTWAGAMALAEAGHVFRAAGHSDATPAYRSAYAELERVFGPDDPRVKALAEFSE
tara:strand:- start:7246 stop:10092 length:2847 start_codon:yes stop_codon:yes gene_type:complete